MLCNFSVKLSKWILYVHPRSDSTELAEAVPTDPITVNSEIFKIILFFEISINRPICVVKTRYMGMIYLHQ